MGATDKINTLSMSKQRQLNVNGHSGWVGSERNTKQERRTRCYHCNLCTAHANTSGTHNAELPDNTPHPGCECRPLTPRTQVHILAYTVGVSSNGKTLAVSAAVRGCAAAVASTDPARVRQLPAHRTADYRTITLLTIRDAAAYGRKG